MVTILYAISVGPKEAAEAAWKYHKNPSGPGLINGNTIIRDSLRGCLDDPENYAKKLGRVFMVVLSPPDKKYSSRGAEISCTVKVHNVQDDFLVLAMEEFLKKRGEEEP